MSLDDLVLEGFLVPHAHFPRKIFQVLIEMQDSFVRTFFSPKTAELAKQCFVQLLELGKELFVR